MTPLTSVQRERLEHAFNEAHGYPFSQLGSRERQLVEKGFLAALSREDEGLRQALERIAEIGDVMDSHRMTDAERASYAKRLARAALAASPVASRLHNETARADAFESRCIELEAAARQAESPPALSSKNRPPVASREVEGGDG